MFVFKCDCYTSRIILINSININHIIPTIKNSFIILFWQLLRKLLSHERTLSLLFLIQIQNILNQVQLVILGELVENLAVFRRVPQAFYCFFNRLTLVTTHVETEELVEVEVEELLRGELVQHAPEFVHGLPSFVFLANFWFRGSRNVRFGCVGNSDSRSRNIPLDILGLNFKLRQLHRLNFNYSSKIRQLVC